MLRKTRREAIIRIIEHDHGITVPDELLRSAYRDKEFEFFLNQHATLSLENRDFVVQFANCTLGRANLAIDDSIINENVLPAIKTIALWANCNDDDFLTKYHAWMDNTYENKSPEGVISNAFNDSVAFFNNPRTKPDFEFWRTAEALSADEATALSFSKSPTRVNEESIRLYKPGPAGSQFKDDYLARLDLIRRAQIVGILPDPIRPKVFAEWASHHKIPWPQQMRPLDRKHITLDEALKRIRELEYEIDRRKSDEHFSELRSTKRMLIGMAISRFGYITSKKDEATKNIEGELSDLAGFGIDVSVGDDTIGKRLSEAARDLDIQTNRSTRTLPKLPALRNPKSEI